MAKSWEEIKREREQQIHSLSNPTNSKTRDMLNQGFLVADNKPQQRKWEDIKKERGYKEPEPEPIDYWKEQPVRTALKNINAGINMLPKGMVGIADATIGSLGIKPVNKFLEGQKDFYKKYDEELAMLNKGHEFAGGVAQGIGQAIPTMALALMNPATAVGSAVPTTAKGTQLVANAASLANPTTLNAARTVALQLKSNPTLYSSMVTSVGNQYLQGLNEGASREEAIKSAIIGGVPSALIEVSGGIENLANIMANKTKGLVGVALQAAIEEGFEEIVQYPIENIGQKVAYEKDMPLFSMKEQAVINPKEMAFSGAVGATVGGLMGGGAAGVNTALYKNYSKQLDTMYKNTIDNLPEDSPILERVRQLQDDNVNIDDNTKLWVINSAREGGMEFESETDKLLQKGRQKETFFSNDNKVQDQLVEQGQNIVKTQNIASHAVNPVLSTFNIQNINNAREVKQSIYEFYKNSIISDSNTSKPILNKSSGMNVEVSRATINQTFQADEKYATNQDNEIKVVAMADLINLIQNGEFTVVDDTDTPSSKVKYAEIKGTVNFNDTPYEITMDIRRTDNGRKLFVHSLSTNYQQVSGKKSGVIYNGVGERVRQQYPKVYDILDRMGKATNTKFKFVDTIYDPTGQMPGFANGQYDPTTDSIEIALDTFNPFMVVAKHEITHMLEKESPKLYREYKGYVLSTMKENGTYDVQYERMAELYKSRGLEVDKNAIEDELVADATELFLTDENAINQLVAENKTLGQKILDILRKLIEKIEDILEVARFTEGWMNTEQLREAEKLWVNALSSVVEAEQKTTKKIDKKQHSLKDDDVITKTYGEKPIVKKSPKEYNISEIKDMILTNHNEYKNNKEALKLAAEAIKDLQKVKFSISSTGREVDWDRAGIRTIADGISREFINKGYVELKGRKVNSLEELAVIGQIFRDPRFETFRIFYTKNNKIVAHEAISSRIPGLTSAFLNVPKRSEYINEHEYQTARNDFIKKRYDDMKDRMKRLKADGYYLLHNHPSGNPKASKEDAYSTKGFMDNVEGFKGHVIINSNKYGWLEMGEYSYSIHVEDMAQQQIELFLKPTIEHPLLNVSITGVDKAASIAKSLQLSKDKTTIIYADVKGVIRGIEEIPNGMFNDGISIRGFLRNRGRHFGSGQAFLSTTSQDIFGKSANLVKEKYLTDSILLTGSYDYYSHRADTGIEQDHDYEWAGIRSDELESARVNEENEVFYTPQGVEVIKNPTNKQIEQLRADFRKEFPELAKQGEPPTRRTYDIDGNVYYWKSTDGLHYNIEHYIDKKYNTRTEQNKNFDIKYDDKKFSLKAPIEETKDLIAIHNISEEKLKGILELGGFPVPSIAVLKAEQEYKGFGDISVIFNKDTINPSDRRNKVFASDVYSPTFPRVSFKFNDSVVERLRNKLNKAVEGTRLRGVFPLNIDEQNMNDKLSRNNNDFVEAYKNEPSMKLAYLKDRGINFKPVLKRKTYGRLEPELITKIIGKMGNKIPVKYEGVEQTMKIEPELRQVMNEYYGEFVKDTIPDYKMYPNPMTFMQVDNVVRAINSYKNDTDRMIVDRKPTEDKLNRTVKKKDFESWLKEVSKDIIAEKGIRNKKNIFSPSGNRRSWKQTHDAYTLDNVLKLLKGDIRDEEGFNYGLGSLRANVSKQFKSIQDIKDNKELLVSEEEFAKIKEEYSNEYIDLISRAMVYHPVKYGDAYDISMSTLAKKGVLTPSALKREFKEDGFDKGIFEDEKLIKDSLDFLQKLKSMPTSYFEAKPQRAVGFDEVAAMVVPKTTDKELLQQLKGKNIKVIKYDEKIEGDRLKKVNSVKGVKFSLKDSQGRTLTQEQAEYFKDSKVRDSNGNLLVMYHGTPKGGFTKFKSGTYFTQNKEYADNYQSPNASSISVKQGEMTPQTYEVYLNIKKPFDTRQAKERKIFQDEFYRKYGTGTPLMESGLPDWMDGMDLQEFIEEQGYKYDGLILDEGGTGGYGEDVRSRGFSYVVFDSNQVKNVDNLKPTNDADIRYSLKDNKGNELSEQQAEFFKDSVVKDRQERLKVMYHGTLSKFNTFRSGDIGFHFGNKTQATTKVGKGANTRIIEAYINLKNPLKVKFDSGNWNASSGLVVKLYEEKVLSEKEYNELMRTKRYHEEGYYAPANIELRKLLEEKGYDGIEYPNWYEGKGTSKSYIIFDSNQAKLIDNKTPTDSPDIRYQLRDNKSVKDIEKLQNTVARLKEQFKLTKGVKLDEKAVRKLAKAILKDYSSKYSSSELEVKLYNVYMGMVNGTMEYDEAQSIITEAAREIIENASVLNDAMYRQYSELRNTMRNTAISIDDRYKGDFDAVGGWNDFRKRNFGRMNITSDGMSIDKLYQELSDSYPELFLKDVANPADQLMLISDVLDSLVPIYENPYNRELNEAVEYLALEIFDGMTSVPEAKPTFADRKKAEKQKAVEKEKDKSKARVEALKNKNAEDVAWLKYQNKEKLKGILEKEKAKRDEAVAKVRKQYQDNAYKTWWRNKLNENDIKSHYQEMIKELRINRDEKLEQQKTKYKERISGIYEDRKIRQAKDRIRTMAKKLDKMLRSPTQKQHIPKALDKTIAELLTMLDFTTDRQKETTQIKLRDLRAEYEKIAKVSDEDGLSATADPYIVEALEMLHNKRIVDMNLQEIELLRDIVGYFENMVRTYNKAFLGDKWIDVSTKAEGIIKDLETDTPMTESAYGGILYFKDMMNWGMLTPQMFFERMGNTFNSLYDDFRAALDVKINNTKIAQDYMSNLLADSKDKVKEWTGKKAEIKTIKLDSGKTIELTQSQLMSFYLLMKREQARGHIFGLGIKAAPIVAVNNKGIKYVKKQFEPVKITLDDATRMIAMLSKEQRRIADGIGKFMNTYSKQWVNEATLQNYGYELAKEENYFPIKVDRDFLKSDFDNTNLDPTFTSMGFLKATIKGAGNAIILEDVFDVFTEHADKAATYNAFVGVTESTKKIVNYKTQDNSIKQAMNKKFGIQAFNYLKKFMVDLQGGIRTESGSPIVTGLIRRAKRAVLGLNLRTIIQQPTAIVRASALIDVDYLIKGVAMKSDKAEMLEKSPIARWKSWGYFNLDTGRSMKDIILDTVPILDKQYQGMQIADDITWTKIWNAVKLEIEDNEPGLKVGSAEYFDAVNYRFNEIIDRTQVVDTVMHRSDAMRQSDSSWKILTAFMSEPTKSYNLLLNAVEKYSANKSVENKKVLLRTFSAWTATMLVNTLVISMLDMWRRKEDDKETFKDKWIDNILNDVTGYVPIVRDIYSLFEGYSVKRMEYNGIERIVRAINRSKKYIEEIAEDKKHSYPLRLITKDWIESVAYVFGVGAINVSKDLEALLRNYTRWIDDEGAINEIYEFMFKK